MPRSDAARARSARIAHRRADGDLCWSAQAEGNATLAVLLGWERPATGAVTSYGVPVADVIARTDTDARVAAALREKHVAELAASPPVLDQVELWERPYLGNDGTWRNGAYFEIRLAGAPGGREGWYRLDYDVSDGEPRAPLGGCAMFQGGSGAGPALEEPMRSARDAAPRHRRTSKTSRES